MALLPIPGTPINTTTLKNGGGALYRDNRDLLYPISTRSCLNSQLATSDYAQSYKIILRNGAVPIMLPQISFVNAFIDNTTGLWSTTGVSRAHLRCSLEYPRTSRLERMVTGTTIDNYMEPGQRIILNEGNDVTIAAFQTLYVHVFVECVDSSGAQLTSGRLPVGPSCPITSGMAIATNASAADQTGTLGGETTSSPGTFFFGWELLAGRPQNRTYQGKECVLVIGDSIEQQWGDNINHTSDADGNQGYIGRWLNYNNASYGIGAVNCAIKSTKSTQFVGFADGSTHHIIDNLCKRVAFTRAIIGHGVNDVTASTAAATIYANNIAIVDKLWNEYGIKSHLRTLTPTVSTTSDFFATVSGQTPNAGNVSRTEAYNALVRAGDATRPYLGPCIDLDAIWGTNDGTGKWKAAATDWTSGTPITFTGALTAATSGTLTAAWTGATVTSGTGKGYAIKFSDGTIRLGTLTNGSTAVTWSGTVTATASANVLRAYSVTADGTHASSNALSTIQTDLGTPASKFTN